jgi:hypothetical protein
MDTGAQQDAPDTGADTSSAGTADNAGASSKSTDIDKGKDPEVPEVRVEQHKLLWDRLRRPRRRNQHPRLQLRRRLLLLLPRPTPLL